MKKYLFLFAFLTGLVTTQVTNAMDNKADSKAAAESPNTSMDLLMAPLKGKPTKKSRTAIPGNFKNLPEPDKVMEVFLHVDTKENLQKLVPRQNYTYQDCLDVIAEELLTFLQEKKKDPRCTLEDRFKEMYKIIGGLKIDYKRITIFIKINPKANRKHHERIYFVIDNEPLQVLPSKNNTSKYLLYSALLTVGAAVGWMGHMIMNQQAQPTSSSWF